MAFYNKIGSLMRQSISQNTVSGRNVTGPSVFNAIRCMSSKLFIGGLSYQTDDHSLKEAFSGFGEVVEARVINDRESGRSRGFGFVSYSSEDMAKEAMTAMDGQELNGRSVRVSLATERAPRSGGYSGGGGGGYNRGYGGGDGDGDGDGGNDRF